MSEVQHLDKIIQLLQSYVLDGLDLPHEQVMEALRLLDWAMPDARPWPDGGDEAPVFADGRVVFPFSRKFVS
jgi:hypothetical protein